MARQVAASLPVVLTERLAWVPVTTWPELVSLTPTFQWASLAADCLAPWRLGPEGRVPPLREEPALPTLARSSRTFWESSRALMSGLPWRDTVAAEVLRGVLADLPRLERASRRASTRARLGSRWAVRFGVERRSAPWPARLLRLLRAGEAWVDSPWHLQGFSAAGATGAEVAVAGADFARSVRVRSVDESARLPRLERASRRASTRSRLGLAIGRAALRWLPLDGAARLRLGVAGAAARAGAGLGAVGADSTAAAAVRVGRASSNERTRLGPEVNRLAAFLPPLVRALRRSRAASRLDVLAMSARRMEFLKRCDQSAARTDPQRKGMGVLVFNQDPTGC